MSPNIHGAVHIKYNGAKSKHCTHNFHFILFSVAFEYSPMYSCREMVRCRCECVFVGQNLIYISRTKTKKKNMEKHKLRKLYRMHFANDLQCVPSLWLCRMVDVRAKKLRPNIALLCCQTGEHK